MAANTTGGTIRMAITSRYPRSASNARMALPVAAHTDSGMIETIQTSVTRSSK